MDVRGRDQLTEITNPAAMHQQSASNNSIQDSGRTSSVQLQLIPTSTPSVALTMPSSSSSAATTVATTITNNSRLMVHNNAISVIGTAAATHQQQQQMQLTSNSNNCVATATGTHIVNHSGNTRSTNTANSIGNAGQASDANNSNICVGNQMITITSNGDTTCGKTNSMNITCIDGHQQQRQHSTANAMTPNQNQQQIENINRSLADTSHNNLDNVMSQRPPSVSVATNRMVSNAPIVTSAPPLVLSLSQVSF